MRTYMLFFLTLFACEEKEHTFQGTHKNLIFSSQLRKNKQSHWDGQGSIALHSHVDINVLETTWMKNYRSVQKNPKNQKRFEKKLAQSHNIKNIKEHISILQKKGFQFSTPLPILSTQSTEFSAEHLGSIVVTSTKEGSFPIEVKGLEVDTLSLTFTQPTSWELSPYHQFPQSKPKDIFPSSFCIAPESSLPFLLNLYDKDNNALAWNFPNWEIKSSSPELQIENTKENDRGNQRTLGSKFLILYFQ